MIHRFLLPALSVCLLALPVANPVSAAEEAEQAAQAAAEQWLALLDGGQYGQSWQSAAPFFKSKISEAQWSTTLATVRKPLGSLVSRKVKRAKFTKSVPGAPDGSYVILQFQTAFSNQKGAIETVTPMLDQDGRWKVSGYYIK